MRGARFLRQALERQRRNTGSHPVRISACGPPSCCVIKATCAPSTPDDVAERGVLPAAVQAGRWAACRRRRWPLRRASFLTRMQSSAPMEERIAAAARLAKAREPQALAFLRQLSRDSGPYQLLAAPPLAAPSEPAVGPVLRKVLADRQAAVPARVPCRRGTWSARSAG